MRDLQKVQSEFDEQFWQHKSPQLVKERHVLLHLMKSTAKLAAYVERREHGVDVPRSEVDDEVVADLLFHALQLSNLYDLDLQRQYEKRLEDLRRRLS